MKNVICTGALIVAIFGVVNIWGEWTKTVGILAILTLYYFAVFGKKSSF